MVYCHYKKGKTQYFGVYLCLEQGERNNKNMGIGFVKEYVDLKFIEVNVDVAYYQEGKLSWDTLKGIIDTGCGRTSILEDKAKELGLKVIREETYSSASSGENNGYIYQMNEMVIENKIHVLSCEIGSMKGTVDGIQMLIGTDILKKCNITLEPNGEKVRFIMNFNGN